MEEKSKYTKTINWKQFYRNVFALVIPIAIQNLINVGVTATDVIMLGKVGEKVLSGASLAGQIQYIMTLIFYGVTSGATVLTAQYWGKKDTRTIEKVLGMGLSAGLIVAVVFAGAALGMPETLMRIYTSDPEVIAEGVKYLRIVGFSYVFMAVTQVYLNIMRSIERVMVATFIYLISLLMNIVVNAILIFGLFGFPVMGVRGAAVATVLSRYVEACIVLSWTHKHTEKNIFAQGLYSTLKVPANLTKKILIKGTPLLLNETLWAAGVAMLTQCYSVRGLNVVAGLNISNTINNVFNIIFIALGDSVAIVVGQLLGAGKMKEARDTDNKMIAFSVFCCTCVAAVMFVMAPLFPRLYNTNAEARTLAKYFIMLTAFFMPQNAFLHATYFTLRSGGKTIVTFLFDSVFIWVVSVTIAFTLSRFTGLPVLVIYAMVQAADMMKCVIGFILVKKGVWLQNIVS